MVFLFSGPRIIKTNNLKLSSLFSEGQMETKNCFSLLCTLLNAFQTLPHRTDLKLSLLPLSNHKPDHSPKIWPWNNPIVNYIFPFEFFVLSRFSRIIHYFFAEYPFLGPALAEILRGYVACVSNLGPTISLDEFGFSLSPFSRIWSIKRT